MAQIVTEMAKAKDAAQLEFIKDLLRKGTKRKDIVAEFAKKWRNVSERTIDRRIKDGELAMQTELQAIQAATASNVAKEVANQTLKLLSVAQRQDVLSRIAMGKLKAKKWYFSMEGAQELDAFPEHTDMINAIKELNKMDGSYAPIQKETMKVKKFTVTRG